MSDQRVSVDYTALAVALLMLAWWGEPDIADAIICNLMDTCPVVPSREEVRNP